MRIAIVGSGNIGGGLGRLWTARGYDVVYAARDAASPKLSELLEGGRARAAPVKEAAGMADVVVLAVPWAAAPDAIRAAGDLSGKVLVDCTNPVASGLAGLTLGHTTSAAEQVAEWAEGARVVKAFNSIGAKNLAAPDFGGQRASVFICGDDIEAKHVVRKIAEDLGFDVVDTGPLAAARLLEPLGMLWIRLAYAQGFGPDIAFRLMRRGEAGPPPGLM